MLGGNLCQIYYIRRPITYTLALDVDTVQEPCKNRVYSRVRKDYTPLRVYVGCVWVIIYVKYITYECLLHNTLALDVDTVQERCYCGRNLWIGPIHGSRCAIYGSLGLLRAGIYGSRKVVACAICGFCQMLRILQIITL